MAASEQSVVRTIYLYLFALVGLFILVFSAVSLGGALLSRYVNPEEFVAEGPYGVAPVAAPMTAAKHPPLAPDVAAVPAAPPQPTEQEQRDNFRKRQNNDFRRRVNESVPGVLVGFFLWIFHWRRIAKERKGK